MERTLEVDPDVSNADLFAGAREIDPSVAELSARQFHAKYPLQVKARLARAAAPKPETPPEPEVPTAEEPNAADAPPMEAGDPVAVRRLLLGLAKEFANAESQADTIEVMARLDDYVAAIMEAAQIRARRDGQSVPRAPGPAGRPPWWRRDIGDECGRRLPSVRLGGRTPRDAGTRRWPLGCR